MTADQMNALADEALNVACRLIQDRLGVETGDVAGLYFSGPQDEQIRTILFGYIKTELNWMGQPAPTDEFIEKGPI